MVPFPRAEPRTRRLSILSRIVPTETGDSFSKPIQKQVDGLVDCFLSEALSPVTLSALVVGSFSDRLGRLGVMTLGEGRLSSVPLRWLSTGAGLASEAVGFELTSRTLHTLMGEHTGSPLQDASRDMLQASRLWSWSGPGGWKEGLLSSLLCFGSLRGAGFLGREQNGVVRHLFQSAALVSSQQGASWLGLLPKDEGSLAEQGLRAEILNLQMLGGMGLISSLAPRLHYLERALDLSLRGTPDIFSPSRFSALGPQFVTAEGAVSQPRVGEELEKLFLRPMATQGGSSEGESPVERLAERQRLEKTYYDSLKKIFTHEIAVQDILDSVMEIPSRLRIYREHFLGSLTHSRLKDPASAYLMVLALREVFKRNPLYSSRGSYEEALIQLFAESALADPDSGHAGFALRGLYETLKKGAFPLEMEELLDRYGYAEAYRLTEAALKSEATRLLAQYVSIPLGYYSTEDVETALEFAAHSRFPKVAFSRLQAIFEAQDHPAKLLEIREQPPADQGRSLMDRLQEKTPGEIIHEINGTHVTAFVQDHRLASAAASVLETEYRYRVKHPEQILQNRARLEQAVGSFLKDSRALLPEIFLELLNANRSELARRIVFDFEEKKFEILILPSKKYEKRAKESKGDLRGDLVSVVKPKRGEPQFLVRDLLYGDLSTHEGYQRAFLDLTSRLSSLVQKWEVFQQLYYRDLLQVLDVLPESISHPVHSRLVIRMIASLEEQRWRLVNGLPMEWELADRMGGIVKYLRNWVEHLLVDSPAPAKPDAG